MQPIRGPAYRDGVKAGTIMSCTIGLPAAVTARNGAGHSYSETYDRFLNILILIVIVKTLGKQSAWKNFKIYLVNAAD